jgi:hypothetical protein
MAALRRSAEFAAAPATVEIASTNEHPGDDKSTSAEAVTATDIETCVIYNMQLLGWIPSMTREVLIPVVTAVFSKIDHWNSSKHSSSSCSSSSQAMRSTAFLVVLLVRSVVQLADAVDAAGPDVLFDCVEAACDCALPVAWQAAHGNQVEHSMRRALPLCSGFHSDVAPWQAWRLTVLSAVGPLLAAVMRMAPPAAVAAAGGSLQTAAVAAAAGAEPVPGEAVAGPAAHRPGVCQSAGVDGSSSSRSDRDGQQAKWGHLLRLQQYSPQWAAAAAAFSTKWHDIDWQLMSNWQATGSSLTAEHIDQLYADALALCRKLIAAAPLTVVCNNPSCESLEGVSEAAACCKACAGCGCRYCSVECQRSDWKRHKPACKCMAAAGLMCG